MLMVFAGPLLADDAVDRQIEAGLEQAAAGNYSAALDAFDRAIRQDPNAASAYYHRGRTYFCMAKIKSSVADFDRYVELAPKAESQQWERGIALYYAGEYERGAKQFELYQTFHDNDVENSVWRYLCVARAKSVEEAQKTILPIKDDRRVPMMQIYDLYRGKATPEDVLKAVEAGMPNDRELNARQFYAHLYLGLWYEAAGKKDLAAKHVKEAETHKIGHYMWDVARVHNELRSESKP
jgi:lipoprotein NlpI